MARFHKRRLPDLLADFEAGASPSKLSSKYNLSRRGILRHLVEARRRNLIRQRSLLRILVERTRYDFPRNPEQRLEIMLRCMNGELKQAALLVAGHQSLTRSGIRKSLTELTTATLPGVSTFYDYCVQTLTPAGFLIHETYGKGWGTRYSCFSLSQAGEQCGQPVAAFSIRYAVDNDLSLYDVFGPTSSAGDSRAPYNRARIVELLAQGCSRIVELEEELGLAHTDITYHLKHLEARGFVRFDSLPPERGRKTYQWIRGKLPGDAKTVDQRRTLTGAVAAWLYRNKSGDQFRIARAVNCRHVNDVSKILVGLARQGLAETRFASTNRSEVGLGRKSRLMLDYLQSVRANKQSPEEREDSLIKFIMDYEARHKQGPRPSEIRKRLGWNHGTLGLYMRSLMQQGRLAKAQAKGQVRYTLTK
jgi:DNA-binding transcriptional ArsR family regulator